MNVPAAAGAERSLFDRALALAVHAHGGQVDKAGHPYILHPCAVAASVADEGDVAMAVALLHDVVEDTLVTLKQIHEEFGDAVAEPVGLLTKVERVEYAEYLERICQNPVAAKVKLADMRHNLGRVDQLPAQEADRLRAKYEGRILALEAVVPSEPAIIDLPCAPSSTAGGDEDWAALYVMVSADGSVAKIGACERLANVPARRISVEKKLRERLGDGAATMTVRVKGELVGLSLGGYDDSNFDHRWAEVVHHEAALRMVLARRLGGLHGWADYITLTEPVRESAWPELVRAAWAEVSRLGTS